MSGGYTGKMLIVDLKTHATSIEKTDLNAAKEFIGAKGLGAKILFDKLPKGTDPLSPKNILMFTTGPLLEPQFKLLVEGLLLQNLLKLAYTLTLILVESLLQK